MAQHHISLLKNGEVIKFKRRVLKIPHCTRFLSHSHMCTVRKYAASHQVTLWEGCRHGSGEEEIPGHCPEGWVMLWRVSTYFSCLMGLSSRIFWWDYSGELRIPLIPTDSHWFPLMMHEEFPLHLGINGNYNRITTTIMTFMVITIMWWLFSL